MFRRLTLLAVLALITVDAGSAFAQRRGRTRHSAAAPEHRIEIAPYGGYSWTFSRRITLPSPLGVGDIDITDSGMWGVQVAFNARPGGQLMLLYQRQDADVEFRQVGFANLRTGLGVEYWHIGGIGGTAQRGGRVLPYASLSIGGTRYIFKEANQDEWKFSMMFGLGVKVYTQGRLGFFGQAKLPWTITNGGIGIGFGTGGAGAYVGGTGMAQIDVSGGIILKI